MIKITHIIGRLSYGGAEKLLLDLCRKIDKNKFEVSVLVLQDDNPLQLQFEEAGVSLKFFHKRSKWDWSIVKKLTQYLMALKPDIVHTHLFAADFWGGQAALRAKVPCLISTKHDILDEGFWRNTLGRRLRRKFNKIIAISEATRDFLIETEKISPEKVEIIYNGIDVNKFYVENSAILNNAVVTIGSIGRLSKEKGQKHLIHACRFLKERDWRLVLVGDGPTRKELEELVVFLGLENKVRFTGIVNDVRPELNNFDIFVLPSISEGLSLAILEAALAGKFVIATRVGGVPEIIRHEENGLLFKPKNIEQLLAQLNWVIKNNNKEEANKMARQLQREVSERFNMNVIIKQYQELYENFAGK